MHKVELSVTAQNRIKGMVKIRDCTRRLIEYQLEGYPDHLIEQEQRTLNHLYDEFTAKYGLLNSRGNNMAFSDDSSYYLSLSGVYQPRKELSKTPLPIALIQFLQDNPHINHITLCLDHDDAGLRAAMAISALLSERYTTELLPPEVGKDYNEQLMAAKSITAQIRTRGAKSALHHFKEERQR